MGAYAETFPRWFADLILALDRAERADELMGKVSGALFDISRESGRALYIDREDVAVARRVIRQVVEVLRTETIGAQVARRVD